MPVNKISGWLTVCTSADRFMKLGAYRGSKCTFVDAIAPEADGPGDSRVERHPITIMLFCAFGTCTGPALSADWLTRIPDLVQLRR
jgi:hypothetical protein